MASVLVQMRVPVEDLERIDRARGLASRSAWLRALAREACVVMEAAAPGVVRLRVVGERTEGSDA